MRELHPGMRKKGVIQQVTRSPRFQIEWRLLIHYNGYLHFTSICFHRSVVSTDGYGGGMLAETLRPNPGGKALRSCVDGDAAVRPATTTPSATVPDRR